MEVTFCRSLLMAYTIWCLTIFSAGTTVAGPQTHSRITFQRPKSPLGQSTTTTRSRIERSLQSLLVARLLEEREETTDNPADLVHHKAPEPGAHKVRLEHSYQQHDINTDFPGTPSEENHKAPEPGAHKVRLEHSYQQHDINTDFPGTPSEENHKASEPGPGSHKVRLEHSYQQHDISTDFPGTPNEENHKAPEPETHKVHLEHSYQQYDINTDFPGTPSEEHHDKLISDPRYKYVYEVQGEKGSGDYGHTEMRDGVKTWGRYFVHQPDGRVKTVRYWADHSGYHAEVDYHDQGEAVDNHMQLQGHE